MIGCDRPGAKRGKVICWRLPFGLLLPAVQLWLAGPASYPPDKTKTPPLSGSLQSLLLVPCGWGGWGKWGVGVELEGGGGRLKDPPTLTSEPAVNPFLITLTLSKLISTSDTDFEHKSKKVFSNNMIACNVVNDSISVRVHEKCV